jgi:hypothetical protein
MGCSRSYQNNDVMRYLPTECPAARVYINVAALWPALGSKDFADPSSQRPAIKTILQALQSGGIDLGKDVQEVAICAKELPNDDDDPKSAMYAMGGNLGGKDALKKYKSVVMAVAHVEEKSIIQGIRDGVPYLTSKRSPDRTWIAMPAPNVLVFSTGTVSEVAALKTPHGVSVDAWRAQPGTLVGFEYTAPVDEKEKRRQETGARGRLVAEGTDLVLEVEGKFDGLQNLDNDKLDNLRRNTAEILNKSELSGLSGPVSSMGLAIRDDALHVHFKIGASTLLDVLKKVQANPKSLRGVLGEMMGKRAGQESR